jgi:hypothetical protein
MGPHRRSSHDSGGGDNANKSIAPESLNSNTDFDVINGPWPCGVPKGTTCLYSNGGSNSEHIKITQEDLKATEAAKLVCSNEHCPMSPFLHAACFTSFEESVLVCLRSQGRARGWSEKQRVQNLWTKRGYDLVYKACESHCGHGYVRKDLDWNHVRCSQEAGGEADGAPAEEINGTKRKRKKSRSQTKGTTIQQIGLPTFSSNLGGQHQQQEHHQSAMMNGNNNNITSTGGVNATNSGNTASNNQSIKLAMDHSGECGITHPSTLASSQIHHQEAIKISNPQSST